MINIKNINVRFNNIISYVNKNLKLVTNNLYYLSTFIFMSIAILPSFKNNNIDLNDNISCSEMYSFDNTMPLFDFDLDSQLESKIKDVKLEVKSSENETIIEEINEKIIEIENIFVDMPKLEVNNESVYYREAKAYKYTEEEFEQICKIAFLEAGGTTEEERYIDSMAVVSVILNRIEDERWCTLGSTPLEQIYAENQFSSLNASLYLDYDDVPSYTRNAVFDCLNGIRNNNYVSFRAKKNVGKNRVQIVNQGNNYFGKMKEIEKVLKKTNKIMIMDSSKSEYEYYRKLYQ